MKNYITKICLPFALIFILSFAHVTILAKEPLSPPNSNWKKIEVIVFSKITRDALLSEQWFMPNEIPHFSTAVNLVAIDSGDRSFASPLSRDDWQLNSVAYRLAKHHYRILLHRAWIQNFSSSSKKSIFLSGGKPLQSNFLTHVQRELNGTINIRLNRYFEVNINLLFIQPTDHLLTLISGRQIETNFHNLKTDTAYFSLKQKRRLKSNELNYFFHPLFGILIKISN
jgi:hypothetical protein